MIGFATWGDLHDGDDLALLVEQHTPVADTQAEDSRFTLQRLDVVGLRGWISRILFDLCADQRGDVGRDTAKRPERVLAVSDPLLTRIIAKW